MNNPQHPQFASSRDTVSFIPLGGIENVTRNMYVYEYQDEILVVDCGLGFPDETMLGVDLMLPDISYLLQNCTGENPPKKIVGMVLTHGHEDHIGGLPFILPQLPNFPIYASPLTAAFANEKLKEYKIQPSVQAVEFDGKELKIGSYGVSFIHITHSIPDSANIFIKTPAGNLYHGSDYKFDLTPANGHRTDFQAIARAEQAGIMCLLSDALGSERKGFTPSERTLQMQFEREMQDCKGKFIITTYSSNISRLNQAIAAAEKFGRKVCFVGRSLLKNKIIAQQMGYLQMRDGTEVKLEAVKKIPDHKVLLLVAGSQGQENSAMMRIATGEHKEIKLSPHDLIVFSSDPIPGNEASVYGLMDTIAKSGARVLPGEFHVSGHGSSSDTLLMISLTNPKYLLPISGNFRHMTAYRGLAESVGYAPKDILLVENGQEVHFTNGQAQMGKKLDIKNVYVDQISGEEVESFVLRDRERLAKEGIVVLMAEIRASDGQLTDHLDVVSRGFSPKESKQVSSVVSKEIRNALAGRKGRVTNWIHVRRMITEVANRRIFKELHRQPLVLPVIIEV